MSKRFKRQDNRFYPKLGTKWRSPKGCQSKMRERIKGAGKIPNAGYRTAKAVRGTVNGKKVTYVAGLSGIIEMKKGDTAMLSSTIGIRNLMIIAAKAKELGVEILNRQRIRSGEKAIKVAEAKKAAAKEVMKKNEVAKKSEQPDGK